MKMLGRGVAIWVLIAGLFMSVSSSNGERSDAPPTTVGQTATLLPDGRWLLLGGMERGGPVASAAVWDPRVRSTIALAATLAHARAWHTATLLADGTILVLGGVGMGGTLVGPAEVLDLEAGAARVLAPDPACPRMRHSATVLTDGRVLVAGGISETGETLATAELWDVRARAAAVLPALLVTARSEHEAVLAADGAVILWGGVDSDGYPTTHGERFEVDPYRFVPVVDAPTADQLAPPQVEASLPDSGAVDVPTDVVISLRLSGPLPVERIQPSSVALVGPEGPRPVRVVPVEAGRLLFIAPEAPLAPGVTYALSSSEAAARGAFIPFESLTFTTAGPTGQHLAPAHGAASAPVSPPMPATPMARDGAEDAAEWTGERRGGRPYSAWQALPPLEAARGATALAGQVLRLDGEPLADVSLVMGSTASRTDHTGRFLLAPIPSGHQELVIDGRSANRPSRTYGVFEIGVEIERGRTNVLPFTSWMPRIDTRHAVRLPARTAQEIVVTTPRVRGLELHIPPQSVVQDHEGRVATEISLTPIPPDRAPFPLPAGVDTPAYFTIQPGGGYVRSNAGQGARLVYPNYQDHRRRPPGARFDFWHYDPEGKGWHAYGQGTVSDDGAQVIPDAGVEIYEFTGAMITGGSPDPPPPATAPTRGGDAWDGEPVDLSTGLFVHRKTDLYLHDKLPIALTRTYRPGDPGSRAFGIGASHPYQLILTSTPLYQYADLLLPDGSVIHYDRTSPGTDAFTAVFEHTGTATAFHRSTIQQASFWLLSLTDGSGYSFGREAPVKEIQDAFLRTIKIARANINAFGWPFGNITRLTSPGGRWIDFTYDALNRITEVRDNLGRVVRYAYDVPGRLASVTDPEGGVTRYTYDAAHQMLTIEDPRGVVYLTNEYDVNGRVVQQILPDQGVYTFAYTLDAAGKVTRTDVTDPRGVVRRVTFDARGHRLTDTRALGTAVEQTMTYERDALGAVLSMTDPLGRTTAYTYNDVGNVTSVTRLAGSAPATTTMSYAATGAPVIQRITSIVDPAGQTTSFAYDLDGAPALVTDPLGFSTRILAARGTILQVADPLGNTTALGYDVSGDVISATDPLGRVTARGYDGVGRLISETDPRGRTTTLGYDGLDRLTQVTDPAGGVTRFQYDPNGNLVAVVDARGRTTGYAYDAMDRVTSRTDPRQGAESYAYDANGNLTTVIDRKGQVTTVSHDPLNRPALTTYADGSTIAYGWDAGNRLVQVVDSVGGSITRGYDLLDRLTSEVSPSGTVAYAYDAAGRRTSMTVLGEPTVSYGYDAASRLTQISRGGMAVDLRYDVAGRRTALAFSDGTTAEYAYDAASQLIGLTHRRGAAVLGNLTYTYDGAGNRIRVGGTWARLGLPQPVGSATTDDANRLLTFGGLALAHDLNGNLTSDGVNTYTWNVRNQLVAVDGPGLAASFGYDALGRRQSRQVDGVTIGFLYDGVNPVQEIGPGGTVNLLEGLEVDQHLARLDPDGTLVPLTDALGSIIALADAAGTVATEYTYEPFGATLSTGAPTANPHQFTGRENDATGLYAYRARYYHPRLQRFISEDPIGFAGGDINLYAYARNNPATFTDPFGLDVYVAFYPTFVTHVGVGINTTSTIGFYPASPGASLLAGISTPGVVKGDTALVGKMLRISTSPAQDRAMQEAISIRAQAPGSYNLYRRNCTLFAASVLRAGSLPVPNTFVPEHLVNGLPRVLDEAPQPVPWSWINVNPGASQEYRVR